jgi:hypothetical protein
MAEEYDLSSGEEAENPSEQTQDEEKETAGDFPLLSAEDFQGELEALEGYAPEEADEIPVEAADEVEEPSAADPAQEYGADEERDQHQVEAGPSAFDEGERLRQPRALIFRRRLQNQIRVLPLALFLLALGVFLIARYEHVKGLPDLSTLALLEIGILVAAFTCVFHALLSGRRERGLLFLGLWVWITAGMVFVVVYGIDDPFDVTKWWPLLLWSLGLTLLFTYLLERTHDVRLVLLSTVVLVAGGTAYWITSGQIGKSSLDKAAKYWPLLLSVIGVGLLPLAFRRRTGS